MLFNSFGFLALFAVFVVVYYLAAPRYRWLLIAGASLAFYATFRLDYVVLLVGVSAVAYGGGIAIARATGDRARRRWLAGAVSTTVAMLVIAKGLPAAGLVGVVGLSFYSLSAISYLADVYRRELPPDRHVGYLFVYLAFFPKLLAGPIERARPLLAQMRVPAAFSAAGVVAGLQLMLWGLFKKVVIADRLAAFVDAAYRQPSFASPADLVIATYFFAFQLYCDFSGYSDIAIGASRVLGFDLMENFRRPYLSSSAAEFWSRRWHVSLASWFRDYVYIPLGGGRVSRVRRALNVMTVFLASGLWHGANWTFLVWGGLNGLCVVVETAWRRSRSDRPIDRVAFPALRALATFHLILVTWVFFRAASLAEAATILRRTALALPELPALLRVRLGNPEILLSAVLIAVLVAVELVDEAKPLWQRLNARPEPMRWAVYYAMLAGLILLGTWNLRQFVYMQF